MSRGMRPRLGRRHCGWRRLRQTLHRPEKKCRTRLVDFSSSVSLANVDVRMCLTVFYSVRKRNHDPNGRALLLVGSATSHIPRSSQPRASAPQAAPCSRLFEISGRSIVELAEEGVQKITRVSGDLRGLTAASRRTERSVTGTGGTDGRAVARAPLRGIPLRRSRSVGHCECRKETRIRTG